MEILGITGDDIAKLRDDDLRDLIGLLCEADYRLEGKSAKGITWGGNQDAGDGGLDVVVRHVSKPPENSFIPRKVTGFQVKKSDMPASAITKEMRPKGNLRNEIKNLINEHGSYVIVCSSGSTSESALQRRLSAMKDSIKKEDKEGNLHIDFMDRGKIASWVRSHPSYILWVKNKIGRPMRGWQPYANWSNSPNGLDDEYLLDDELRLHDGTKSEKEGDSVQDGILNLRKQLARPGTSIRVTGLSGVGKTRLVQALFDDRISKNALNSSQVIYSDISDGPIPDPKSMADQLVAERIRGVLVVDNCPPDLHRSLTNTCSQPSSLISLLTIEYDVRDDLPEETSVFRLEPASDQIIAELVKRRYPHISNVDSRSVAEFSGGNSRVAIALANTLKSGETLSGFKDEDLFERLFRQRHESDSGLLISAEICSLVYSFEGVDIDSENSELKVLASLADSTAKSLFRDVTTLMSRDLVQSRNVWRAVLPHAIANRLAKRALESLPKSTILRTFENNSFRLRRSFSKRLGYLHDCKVAIEIAEYWMSETGLLGKLGGKFESYEMSIFKNLAPVSPKAALALMEVAANGPEGKVFTSRKNRYYYEFVRILKQLAYEPDYFQRSSEIICRFALAEKPDERTNSTRDVLKSMFYMYLSGTHAPIEKRINVIEKLLYSSDSDENDLGVLLMGAALEAWHFTSSGFHEFGARPRDYGYEPKTYSEVFDWYRSLVEIAYGIILLDSNISTKVKHQLAGGLRGIITKAGMAEYLDDKIRSIHSQRPWREGWFAVKSVLRYDKDKLDEETVVLLIELEKHLKPKDTLELARAYATSEQHGFYSLEDDYDENEDIGSVWERINARTIKLGNDLAKDKDSLFSILPELLTTNNTRVYQLGVGLAQGCKNKSETWNLLRGQLEETPEDKQNFRVMLGFLDACSKIDIDFYNSILDDILESDDFLVQWFPWFQITSNIDKRGVERLKTALDNDKARIFTYRNLGYGQTHKDIADDELANLLNKIKEKEGGSEVALDILQMRFYRSKEEEKTHSETLIKTAFNTLATFPFKYDRQRNSMADLAMSEIATICFNSPYGLVNSDAICNNVAIAILENRLYPNDFHRFLEILAKLQPAIFLDTFLGEIVPDESYHLGRMLSREFRHFENPLNQISQKNILEWAEINPNERYTKVISVSTVFQTDPDSEFKWKPLVYEILNKVPDVIPILETLKGKIYPSSWSGSLAEILEKRKVLFSSFFDHPNVKVSKWAKEAYSNLNTAINQHRESERLENVQRYESFE